MLIAKKILPYQDSIRLIFAGLLLVYAVAFTDGDLGTLALFSLFFVVTLLFGYMYAHDTEQPLAKKGYVLDLFNIHAIIYVSYYIGYDFGAWTAIPIVFVYTIVSCVARLRNSWALGSMTFVIIIFTFILGGERQVKISKYNYYCLVYDRPDLVLVFPFQKELEAWNNFKEEFHVENPYQFVHLEPSIIPRPFDVTSPNFRLTWWVYPFVIGPVNEARYAMESQLNK